MEIHYYSGNQTKLRLYNTCILPIFLYGAETWSVTVILSKKIHALDIWCLRRILNVHWSEFVTNDEIRSRTGQPLILHCLQPPSVLRWTPAPAPTPHKTITVLYKPALWVLLMIGRPRQSWLRTVEADLRAMNLGLATSKRRAQDRLTWWKLIATATSIRQVELKKKTYTLLSQRYANAQRHTAKIWFVCIYVKRHGLLLRLLVLCLSFYEDVKMVY